MFIPFLLRELNQQLANGKQTIRKLNRDREKNFPFLLQSKVVKDLDMGKGRYQSLQEDCPFSLKAKEF